MLACVAACALFVHVGPAHAAPFDLEWSAPAGCPTRERMIAASREALGEAESAGAPELFVHGNVSAEGEAHVIRLHVRDRSGTDLGEREVRIDNRRCSAIEQPAALLIALMIAVARSRDAPPDAAEPALPAPTPRAPATKERPARSPLPSERERASVPMTLGASIVASRGFLPNVGLGGAARWTAQLSRVVVGVEGSFETTWAVDAASGQASFRLFDLGALGGVSVLRSRSIELIPLIEARGGILSASASGFPAVYDTTRAVGLVGAGVLARVPLGPAIQLEVIPALRLPLAHDVFTVREGGTPVRVHATAPVEGRLAVGAAWAF